MASAGAITGYPSAFVIPKFILNSLFLHAAITTTSSVSGLGKSWQLASHTTTGNLHTAYLRTLCVESKIFEMWPKWPKTRSCLKSITWSRKFSLYLYCFCFVYIKIKNWHGILEALDLSGNKVNWKMNQHARVLSLHSLYNIVKVK